MISEVNPANGSSPQRLWSCVWRPDIGSSFYGRTSHQKADGVGGSAHEIGHAVDDFDGKLDPLPASTPTSTPGCPKAEEDKAVAFENQVRNGRWSNDPGHQRPRY